MSEPENSVHPLSREAWRAWLAEHHARDAGVWLISFKKQTGRPIIPYDHAVEEALCFGWVDSKPARLDADRAMLWFAPRKAGSAWSGPNKARAERMMAAGLMQPAGQAKIDAAKRDGTWTKLDAVEALAIPPDLEAAFAEHPGSRAHFAAFPRSVKRGVLEWIVQAKRPETRAARVAETARLAGQNIRANQWRQPKSPPAAGSD